MKWRKKCFPERESASWPPTKPCTTPTASAAPIAKSISEREGPRPTHAITPASLPTLRDVDWFYRVGIMKKTGTRGIFMGFCFLNWGGRLPAPPHPHPPQGTRAKTTKQTQTFLSLSLVWLGLSRSPHSRGRRYCGRACIPLEGLLRKKKKQGGAKQTQLSLNSPPVGLKKY